jgi:hypothetical protein
MKHTISLKKPVKIQAFALKPYTSNTAISRLKKLHKKAGQPDAVKNPLSVDVILKMATLGIGTFFILKKQMPLIFGKALNNLLPQLYFSAFDISVTPAF